MTDRRNATVIVGHCHRRGFTTIELVVVLIMVAILSATFLPKFGLLMRGYDEIGYRDQVKAALEFARKAAVAQRRYVCAEIKTNDVTFTIEAVEPESTSHTTVCPSVSPVWPALKLPAFDKTCSEAENKICHPGTVTLTPDANILFDALGRPITGSGVYSVKGSESTTTFALEAETGYVH